MPNNTIKRVRYGEVIHGFRGPTGAQTSSLPFIDAGLQISTSINSNENLKITMDEFKQYLPLHHYEFTKQMINMTLRDFIVFLSKDYVFSNNHVISDEKSNVLELIDAYNDAVVSVAEFRYAHMEHVATYIFKSRPKAPKEAITGTGNTPIALYLCKSAQGTLKSIIKGGMSNNLATTSIPSLCLEDFVINN